MSTHHHEWIYQKSYKHVRCCEPDVIRVTNASEVRLRHNRDDDDEVTEHRNQTEQEQSEKRTRIVLQLLDGQPKGTCDSLLI